MNTADDLNLTCPHLSQLINVVL